MLKKVINANVLTDCLSAATAGKDLLVEQLWDAPKAVLASALLEVTGKHLLILTGGVRENRLYDDLSFFTTAPIMEFPAWETLPSEEISPSPDIVGQRYDILKELSEDPRPRIILAPLQACLQRLIKPQQLRKHFLTLKVGKEIIFATLLERLESMGYVRKSIAADKGEYAVRGGIVDLFPVGSPDPFRVEFWGDEIDSIRVYDPIGQKSIRKVESCDITPACEREWVEKEQQLASIFDYLGPQTIIVFDDLLALEDRYVELKSIQEGPQHSFMTFADFFAEAQSLQKVYWTAQPVEQLGEVGVKSRGKLSSVSFPIFDRHIEAERWRHPFVEISQAFLVDESQGANLLSAFRQSPELDLKLHFVCVTESEEERLRQELQEHHVAASDAQWSRGYLSSGFVIHQAHLALVPMTEITHRYRVRRQKLRSTFHSPPSEFTELQPGDYVVHFHNGVGRYLGVESQRNTQGVEIDCLAIEYADKGKLFVPLAQSYLVSKYIGVSEEQPTLHALGSNRWKTMRAKTEVAIRDYAADLLKIHAERTIAEGFVYAADGPDMELFEREFPYVETEDQLQAILNVKNDMRSARVMDRLICGDVGYGKTEVAMRAALKAVVDGGKQVALLVPTTVLAMQHGENFKARMANFPVEIAILSRFQTPKEARLILEKLAVGQVDILIGTHRLISKDVVFRNLGLVIIDEEQRFGVRVKERLRAFKKGVDCLTLTATPIPRTLYMSLVGARDMSVINTPPQDRLPIKTILCEVDEQKIRAAILRELARDGQCYFIHNRVETILHWAEKLRQWVPQARVLVGHGQMSADELDHVFHAFKQGEADILLATTIIENGIDIPNANTILIDRADQFGLADLYQLRGRVGRWNRRAYCYMLTAKGRVLPEYVRRRLSVLLEIGGYGGGMKVAMRDLELRGAGNILGVEQSGHISAIGFHLYCKLLKRTVDALKGKQAPSLYETKVEFTQDARLSPIYIPEANLRMEIYQRLGEATALEEIDAIIAEVEDRFGKLPEPVVWLHRLSRIRLQAARYQIHTLKIQAHSLIAERQKGTQQEVRTLLFITPKDPLDLEKKVVQALEKAF
jgi:transcription-repair coupling factor (superfamily II helicase)